MSLCLQYDFKATFLYISGKNFIEFNNNTQERLNCGLFPAANTGSRGLVRADQTKRKR
jgi:hypothetical protein